MPWLSVFGNHDGLVQGNVPANPLVAQLATGPAKIIDLPPGTDIIQLAQQLLSGDPRGSRPSSAAPSGWSPPTRTGARCRRTETIAEHFNTVGHAARARLHGLEPRDRQRLLRLRPRAGARHRRSTP